MRISDWSSDVFSSDLTAIREALAIIAGGGGTPAAIAIALDRQERVADGDDRSAAQAVAHEQGIPVIAIAGLSDLLAFAGESATLAAESDRLLAYRARPGSRTRSEERRGGKECVSTCSSRWSPEH